MALLSEFPTVESMTDGAQRVWRMPLGAASPLWFAYGAAASAGVAFWWLNQWTRHVNFEAIAVQIAPAAKLVIAEPIAATPAPETAPVAVEFEAAADSATLVAETPEPAPEVVLEPDDLTRLKGIGPKLAAALAQRGVTRFAQIAAWTDRDLAEVDAALKLLGRAERDAWVDQAAKLA
ncbi:MAG: helix-hairpin-helix domain-containing protein [Caulobacterales bacterium]